MPLGMIPVSLPPKGGISCQTAALWRQLVEATTKPGALVLDPFAGSGSTLAAAALTGRQYIGVEIDPEYCRIAQKKVQDALKMRLLKGGIDL